MKFGLGSPLFEEQQDGNQGGVTLEVVTKLVNDTVNGALANFIKKDFKKQLDGVLAPITEKLGVITTALETVENPDDGINDGKGIPPELNARLKGLETALEASNKKLTAAEQKALENEKKAQDSSRAAAVRGAIADFQFANPETKEDVFEIISSKAKFDENGNLIAGDLPLADFVKDYVGKRPNLLNAKQVGGAGAEQGGARGGGGQVAIEDIKPGMDSKTASAAAAQIRAALNSGQ